MPQPATTVRSFCKINLGLRIGPPRPDGFHALHTLFQTVGLHDQITVEAEPAASTAIFLQCNDPRVPTDGRNTVHRMVAGALEAMEIRARVRIFLHKNLPVQGGLGAGSANAAAALLALERQLGTALPGPARMRLAEAVGSDVPLFLVGGTVYGYNRGELVLPYPDLPPTPCVVVAPGVGCSTPLAFRAWDESLTALTTDAAQDRLSELSRVYASAFAPAGYTSETGASGVFGALDSQESAAENLAGNLLPALVRTGMENDFEEVVFRQHPSLRDIKRTLLGEDGVLEEHRALLAALSGSGSSLFGLYRTNAAAVAAQERATALGVRAMVTATVPREAYWQSLFV